MIDNIYYINMDKDTDRKGPLLKELDKITPFIKGSINRVPGVVFNPFFENNKNQKYLSFESNFIQKSAIGCGLAHIKAWENIIKNRDNVGLVLEDDIVISDDFKEVFEKVMIDLPKDFDILFLGCMVFCNPEKDMSIFEKVFLKDKKVADISPNLFVPSRPLALHAYILSSKGAQKLLNYFQKEKLTNHIDQQMLQYYKNMGVYASEPKIINQRFTDALRSNNSEKYPYIFTKISSTVKFKNVDAGYLMGIARYEIGRVPLCGWVALFILLGMLFTNLESMTAFFLLFHSIEMLLLKEIRINSAIIYYSSMVIGFILRKNLIINT